MKHIKKNSRWGWAVALTLWGLLSFGDTLVGHLAPPWFQERWGSWWHPQWGWHISAIGTLVIVVLAMWEGSYRHSKKQEKDIDDLKARLQEIEDVKPCIVLRNAYAEKVTVGPKNPHPFDANVLRLKLENAAQNHYPNNEAKGVIAKISFYDPSGNLLLLDMDGRWTDSTLLEKNFRIGAKHDLDIAFMDVTYPETQTGFVALNNDNLKFSGWQKREHILTGDHFVAKICISAVWVDAEFYLEFWAMPHGEIGCSVRLP